jgi:hypothetical protein
MTDREPEAPEPPSGQLSAIPRRALAPSELAGTVAIGIVALTVELEAYIDPGTGSYLFQLAIAGLLAALYTIKRYWHTIRDTVGPLIARSRAGRSKRSNSGHDGMD